MKRILLAGLCSLAVANVRPAQADLRVAIDNDAFTSVIPPLDDNGFTNDIVIAFWRPHGDYLIGGKLFDRWITEVGGPRRWDEVILAGTLERSWGVPFIQSITASARLGPTFSGNLGGRWMQNGWHSLTRTGPTLDEGLQHIYDGGNRAGVIAGLRGRGSVGNSHAQIYLGLDGQLAVGATGVTYGDASVGTRIAASYRDVVFAAHGELAVARYHVSDPNLALPGGYRAGAQLEWRVGVDVAWGRYMVEYEYRANEGGSHEPIGVLALTIKQAKD